MQRHLYILSVVLVAGLTLAGAVVHGRMRNRWGVSEEMRAAAAQLSQIPRQFGPWRLESTEQMDDVAINMLECEGYTVGRYVHQRTGEAVQVTLLVGPAGPISVHTPEVCMASDAYRQIGERQRIQIPNSDNEFWAVPFRSNNLRVDILRVYYAWSTGGRWSAPDDARFAFAKYPYLYKIQLACSLQPGTNVTENDPCRKFLQDFLPIAEQAMLEPSAN
jgi:hypothetical protein